MILVNALLSAINIIILLLASYFCRIDAIAHVGWRLNVQIRVTDGTATMQALLAPIIMKQLIRLLVR